MSQRAPRIPLARTGGRREALEVEKALRYSVKSLALFHTLRDGGDIESVLPTPRANETGWSLVGTVVPLCPAFES